MLSCDRSCVGAFQVPGGARAGATQTPSHAEGQSNVMPHKRAARALLSMSCMLMLDLVVSAGPSALS